MLFERRTLVLKGKFTGKRQTAATDGSVGCTRNACWKRCVFFYLWRHSP